jgi:hypothetical protein
MHTKHINNCNQIKTGWCLSRRSKPTG